MSLFEKRERHNNKKKEEVMNLVGELGDSREVNRFQAPVSCQAFGECRKRVALEGQIW